MAEYLGHDLWVYPLGEGCRSEGVTKVVEPDSWNPTCSNVATKALAYVVGMWRCAVLFHEDEAGTGPPIAEQELFPYRGAPCLFERIYGRFAESDSTARGGGLCTADVLEDAAKGEIPLQPGENRAGIS